MNNDPVETYLVGGAVRDELLGIPVKEKDWVVVGSTPEAMVDKGFRPVGQSFPVFIHSQSGEEYALARTERKTGRGYKGFSFFTDPSVTLEQDLLRRDLSINAIAMRDNGELIDPLGGRGDIERRVLRHVSDAFLEDPLRVLRVARFVAQLAEFDFTIASETLELMEKMVESGELEDLTAERVWIETEKALQTVRPRLYFETLRKMGALKVLFPEIDRLFGVPQNPKYHPEIDTGLHILLSLDQICAESNVLRLRFSVLVHDLGKGTTPRDQWPSHNGHEERGVKQIENLAKRLRIPNDCRDLAIKVSRWHLHCHRALELKAATIEKLFSGLDLWRNPQLLPEFLSCCQADIRGRTGMENNDYPQAAYLTDCFQAALTVDSQKIREAGFEGEAIGKKMREARIAAIQDAKERRAS
ncbi:MAG: multifunctional CCA addition/repair protein [Porticoccaceae bacterium]|nr:multifunctional CCA addition/repair protein [Porticoccaceae bacterium]